MDRIGRRIDVGGGLGLVTDEEKSTRLPTGTITFLFTDIEGSTRLWEEQPETMRATLAYHDALMRRMIEQDGGHVFKTVGDSFCAAFAAADAALGAALGIQRRLAKATWPDPSMALRVRIALHTGAAELRDNDYFGPPLNRVARLVSVCHGGQTVVSGTTEALVRDRLPAGAGLEDLGYHRLKDLAQPEQVFQLTHPSLPGPEAFPPLRSLSNTPNNLPQQLTSFIGREREIREIKKLLTTKRLITLAGAGGCGKTRLALQIGADILEEYPDGVWLAELAALADPALVPQAVADPLHIREEAGHPLLETLQTQLREKHLLLILDGRTNRRIGRAPLGKSSETQHQQHEQKVNLSFHYHELWQER